MRQYEKIAAPIVNSSLSQHQSWSPIDGGPFIILTVEELRELWKTAQKNRMNMESGDYVETCDSYLTSKGVTIK